MVYNHDQLLEDLHKIASALGNTKAMGFYTGYAYEDSFLKFELFPKEHFPKVWWKQELIDITNVEMESDLAKHVLDLIFRIEASRLQMFVIKHHNQAFETIYA